MVRMTTATGENEVLDLNEDDWVIHPAGDDVAVCPIARPAREKLPLVSTGAFLSRDGVPLLSIGSGGRCLHGGQIHWSRWQAKKYSDCERRNHFDDAI